MTRGHETPVSITDEAKLDPLAQACIAYIEAVLPPRESTDYLDTGAYLYQTKETFLDLIEQSSEVADRRDSTTTVDPELTWVPIAKEALRKAGGRCGLDRTRIFSPKHEAVQKLLYREMAVRRAA